MRKSSYFRDTALIKKIQVFAASICLCVSNQQEGKEELQERFASEKARTCLKCHNYFKKPKNLAWELDGRTVTGPGGSPDGERRSTSSWRPARSQTPAHPCTPCWAPENVGK